MISKNIEIELKVLVSKQQFYSLLMYFKPDSTVEFIEQTNYYYKAIGMQEKDVLRIRKRKNNFFFTFKRNTVAGLEEYEKELPTCAFDEEVIAYLETFGLFAPYILLGTLTTNRYSITIDNKAELSFDINHYNGITDYEIEYECLKEHDYLETFSSILNQAGIPYRHNHCSKYLRYINTKK